MTIQAQSNKTIALGNDATTVFTYTFYLDDADHLVVIHTSVADVQTTLTPSQYALTGVGDPDGGTVTYPLSGSPIETNTTLTMMRVVPYEQPVDLVNQSGFYPEVVEGALDNLEMQIQQLIEELGRDGMTTNESGTVWDADGKRIINAGDPVEEQDVATKGYVDDVAGNAVLGIVPDHSIENLKLHQVDTGTFLARHTAAAGSVEDTTPAQARTILGLPTQFFVKSYGAVCDGVTDDTTAFQACINAALAVTSGEGATVVLEKGNMLISGIITINTSTRILNIVGQGRRVSHIVKSHATLNLFNITVAPQLTCRDFSVECSIEQNAGVIFNLIGQYAGTFRDLWISNPFCAFKMTQGCAGVNIFNTEIQGTFPSLSDNTAKSGAYMIHLAPSTGGAGPSNGINIAHCGLNPSSVTPATRSNYQNALKIEAIDGLWVSDCHIAGAHEAHCDIHPATGFICNGIIMNNVWFDYYGSQCLMIQGNLAVTDCRFTGCTFQGATAQGVQINNINANFIQFNSCTAEFCGQEGLYIGAGKNIKWDGAIFGCAITSGNSCAITVSANTIGVSFAGHFSANAKQYALIFGAGSNAITYSGVFADYTVDPVNDNGTNVVVGTVVEV